MGSKSFLYDKGFSLIELIAGIAILAMIALPLLGNFVTAAKVNKKANGIQDETTLTQNILEEWKAKPLAELAKCYDYPMDSGITENVCELKWDSVNSRLEEITADSEKSCIQKSVPDGLGGITYEYEFQIKTDKPYYFAKRNITNGNLSYDALITVDASAFYSVDPATGMKSGINTVKMPLIPEMNAAKNTLIMESFESDYAVAALYSNHLAYCAEQEAMGNTVTSYSADDIKELLTREMDITIGLNGSDAEIKTEFIYSCSSSPHASIDGCGTVNYLVGDTIKPIPIQDIYLFYYPAYFDTIRISKDPAITDMINLYAVRQLPKDTLPFEVLKKVKGTVPSGINFYSNVDYSNESDLTNTPVSKPLVTEEEKNRLYQIKVQLYPAGTDFTLAQRLSEYISSKGE